MTAEPYRRNGHYGLVTGLVAGVLALGPSLTRGYILRYDMVFVPDQPITATTLGLSGVVPRAVPEELVVALASHVVPGDLVQKFLLLAAFALAGWGIARLLPTRTSAVISAIAFTWNPWVAERLLIGHWGFLLGYAALPWLVEAAVSLRRGRHGALARLCGLTVLVGLSGSTSWGLAVLVTVPVLVWRGTTLATSVRQWAAWAAVTIGSAAVWAVPSLARTIEGDAAGFPAFAARGDTLLGVWGQLLTLGGIWNRAAVLAERTSAVVVAVALLLVVLAVVGGARATWRSQEGYGGAVVVSAGVGFVLAALGSTTIGLDLLLQLNERTAAVGLLRDGHKWLAPFALVVCLSAGHAADRLRTHVPGVAPALMVAAGVAPVVLLPGLVWGAQGRLAASDYPDSWMHVRSVVSALPAGTDVASLPASYYRRYPWNGDVVVLDPVPRYLPRVVVNVDDLLLRDGVVRGEDARGRILADALATGEPLAPVLRAMGVSAVVVAEDQPAGDTPVLAGMPEIGAADGLRVYGVPGPVDTAPRPPAWAAGGLMLWGATVTIVFVSWTVQRVRRLLASRSTVVGP